MENDTEIEKIDKNLSKTENRGGKREGSGRKPGVPNKMSSTVKQNVIEVFQNLGGIEHMTAWATENPNNFYNIYAKILPTQTELSGPDGSELPLGIGITFVKPDDSQVSE
jgi:hypothetical protein